MDEVLFSITKENLETGMRGYPIGYCTTSSVDPQKGLSYSGIPVDQLAFEEPEEVIYLILHGQKPNKDQLELFKLELQKRGKCSNEVLDCIKQLPPMGNPMKLFCAALLILGQLEPQEDYREASIDLIAKIPVIAAFVINHHAGWDSFKPSNPKLGYIQNFVHMVNVPNADQKQLLEAFSLFNILHYDHGGGNLSTFVGKAISSGLEDMYGSMCGAMCGLDGPRHGKANQDSLKFVQEVLKEVGVDANENEVEALVRKRLAENKLVFGFGHAVLRVEDPRAIILFDVANKKYPDYPLVKIAQLLRKAGAKVLRENEKISDPYANVDLISGTLLSAAGFPYPEYFTVLFGMARVVGISRQIVYERCEARDGKGTPIVRPKYIYKARVS